MFKLKATSLCASAVVLFGVLGLTDVASAHDVTFTRNARAPLSSNSYNLLVTLEQQGGGVQRQCTMIWSDADDACTVDFPSSTNALVSVFHYTGGTATQRNVIGKMSFWVSIFNDSTIHIPTGDVSFKADRTFSELASLGGLNIAILPQANLEMGETASNRPNSGTDYFGQTIGNCGSKQLGSDQADTCEISLLAVCYSPVFARGASGSNKAKIWVNRGDALGADHVLCPKDGETIDYDINVQ